MTPPGYCPPRGVGEFSRGSHFFSIRELPLEWIVFGSEWIVFGSEFLSIGENGVAFGSPGFSTCGEVADFDGEGVVLGATHLTLLSPVVAAFENFGEEDADGRLELVEKFGQVGKTVHGEGSRGVPLQERDDENPGETPCQHQVPSRPGLVCRNSVGMSGLRMLVLGMVPRPVGRGYAGSGFGQPSPP